MRFPSIVHPTERKLKMLIQQSMPSIGVKMSRDPHVEVGSLFFAFSTYVNVTSSTLSKNHVNEIRARCLKLGFSFPILTT